MKTRTENIKQNLIFNVVKFASQLISQFAIRTALIYYMGIEYLGLNGLFANVLAFLNLAELGIGTAIVFNMYKPIADNDVEKIKSLQALYKKFYFIISIIVLVSGVVLLPFIKYLINGDVSVNINIYALYLMYLLNTLVGYFAAHRRSLLFAYQRNDIENKVKTVCLIFMTIVQVLILFILKNYYIYFSITILFAIIESLWISLIAKKLYPEISGPSALLDGETKREIKKNITALSFHKIGSVLVFSTDNILISSMLGLAVLGAYSNYYLIISTLASLFLLINNAISASVGNLVASSDKEYVYNKYQQIKFIYAFLSAFSTICMLVLFQPFIQVWTRGGEYLLNFSTVIFLCISFYFSRIRSASSIFKDAAGLFWQNRFAPIFESLINLGVSIGLGLFMGIDGIVIGTILSTLLVPFWLEPQIVYKHYFKKSFGTFLKTTVRDLVLVIVSSLLCLTICSFIPDSGIVWLLVKFAVCIPLSLVVLTILYIPTKEFKDCFQMAKMYLAKLFKSK